MGAQGADEADAGREVTFDHGRVTVAQRTAT
jgi:hypothetical protein